MARWLHARQPGYRPHGHIAFARLCAVLQPGDVLLVEGNERISSAIKYLTQSTWSHAALYVGDALPVPTGGGERPRLIEVNMHEGCTATPLASYEGYNLRICRARLTPAERTAVIAFMVGRLGVQYDLRNIFDLARYFLPLPVPARFRRRAMALGSGDPTRAICSSLIAQAFQSIGYPILPEVSDSGPQGAAAAREILHIRHHSLYAPRDFDLSPYFQVVKPALQGGFDFHALEWD
ncbi:lipo-like protein [Pseudooceanicola sp. GBMRC 2024]|uniref:Lipo-like protein n=2 Tax=Pseudooceanicola albus TaxID=2692189 RepID=A0A6L7G368_9RHOB|nr:lipo-like protein [Pseudooceanicola albus]